MAEENDPFHLEVAANAADDHEIIDISSDNEPAQEDIAIIPVRNEFNRMNIRDNIKQAEDDEDEIMESEEVDDDRLVIDESGERGKIIEEPKNNKENDVSVGDQENEKDDDCIVLSSDGEVATEKQRKKKNKGRSIFDEEVVSIDFGNSESETETISSDNNTEAISKNTNFTRNGSRKRNKEDEGPKEKKRCATDSEREKYMATKNGLISLVVDRLTDTIIVSRKFSDPAKVAKKTVTACTEQQNMKPCYYNNMLSMSTPMFCRKVIGLIERFPEHVKEKIGGTKMKKMVKLLEEIITKIENSEKNPLDPHSNIPLSFMKMTDEFGALHLHEKKTIISGIPQPLGAAYDSVLGFIFTGNQSIYSCYEDGGNSEPMVLVKDAVNPSAITVIKNGRKFAFLDDKGINVFDFPSNSQKNLVYMHAGEARGLALLNNDLLVTATHKNRAIYISGFDAVTGSSISSAFYEKEGSPCFMSSHRNSVYVTDLVLRRLSVFRTDSRRRLEFHMFIDLRGPQMPRKCFFPSGIVVDKRGEIILVEANAESGFILHGNAQLEDWKQVEIKKNNKKHPFPYTAAIAISPSGYLLASCRRSNSIKLYKFEQLVEEVDVGQLVEEMAHATTEDEALE